MAEPKNYKLATREWGVTASEAADILITAEEIKGKPKVLAAAREAIKTKLKATQKVAKDI